MKKIWTNYTTVDWEIWLRIEGTVQKFCRTKWNGTGEDVASQTKITFLEKLIKKEFTYSSDEDSKRYAYSIARRIARDVVGFGRCRREISMDDIPESRWASCEIPGDEKDDERIEIILRHASPAVELVVIDVIAGGNITSACNLQKISYAEFRRSAREAYYQIPLFQSYKQSKKWQRS